MTRRASQRSFTGICGMVQISSVVLQRMAMTSMWSRFRGFDGSFSFVVVALVAFVVAPAVVQ